MSGGSQAPTQTTTNVLSPEQRDILNLAMPGLKEFAATVPKRYSGSQVAGFDPNQVAGQELALNAAGAQGTLASNAANTANFWTGGDVWNPSNNPALAGAVDAAVRPITQNLTETQLPAIRGEASTTGNFGSSRQGIAEGLASRGASQAIGDTSAKLVNDNYKTNVSAQLQALGLLPTVQTAQLAPATTTSAVGDVRQAMAQALLSQDVSGFNYDQLAPFLQSKELLSLLTGMPGGSNVTTGSVNNTGPTATSTLGSAAAGASLGSMFGPVGTGVGAGAGALLPFIFK